MPTDLSEQGTKMKIGADVSELTSAWIKAAKSAGGVAETPVGYDAGQTFGHPVQ